jgi:hypothetical protein
MALSDLAIRLSLQGPQAAGELRRALGVSASTLLRLLEDEGPELIRMGKARATRYGMRRRFGLAQARLPLYRIDALGTPSLVAHATPPVQHATWLEPENGGDELFAGLPPVLFDMAPAGYLGRRFAELNPDLPLPARIQEWSDDHRLLALARRGEDAPGDLVLGEESLDRFLASAPREVRARDYPKLAELSATGAAGSSAAGEQPKFGAFRDGRHFLVKFTPGDGSPADDRWRDLLACESIALEVLAEPGIAASRSRIVDVGSQRFLEVERFDRSGDRGRRGVLTLGAVHDDLFGQRDSWTEAAARLEATRLLSPLDAKTVRLLDAFGMLIGNGDRHFGNLAFFADGLCARPKLQLAPAYDMLPMMAAPIAGITRPLDWTSVSQQPAKAKLLDVWPEATALAQRFWARVAGDERISRPFRASIRQLAG